MIGRHSTLLLTVLCLECREMSMILLSVLLLMLSTKSMKSNIIKSIVWQNPNSYFSANLKSGLEKCSAARQGSVIADIVYIRSSLFIAKSKFNSTFIWFRFYYFWSQFFLDFVVEARMFWQFRLRLPSLRHQDRD